jgi:hypothetical protein
MKRFTPEEDQYIKDSYLTKVLREMGEQLGRTETSIHGRMKILGLVVPPEIISERVQKTYRQLAESGKISRYKKGNVPANKGKKMSPELYEKCKRTMFKTDQIPANCVHFGRPYLHQRTKKSGYVEKLWFIQEDKNKRSAYLAYLCRQHGIDLTGKKPILKPGFDHSVPPTIDDIIIVTHAENMKRNTIHRYPAEVVSLCHLKAALQRQINKYQENE